MESSDRELVDRLKAGSASGFERLERWVVFPDAETCAGCRFLAGRVFFAPEDPRPPLHINCRCGRLPVNVEGLSGVALIRLVLEARANGRQAQFLEQEATRRRLAERQERMARGQGPRRGGHPPRSVGFR